MCLAGQQLVWVSLPPAFTCLWFLEGLGWSQGILGWPIRRSAQAGTKVLPALVTFVTAAWDPPPPELHREQGLDAAQEGFPHQFSPLPTA